MQNRPTIKELCGLNTCTLIGLPVEVAHQKIIHSLEEKRSEVASELSKAHLDSDTGYETVCSYSTKLRYLDKAINARTQDFEEMMNKSPEKNIYKPKGQSKKHSHFEITVNQIAGIIIGWCLVYFVFPIMGIEPTATQATISSALFFVSSYVRSYIIRRIFNKLVK